MPYELVQPPPVSAGVETFAAAPDPPGEVADPFAFDTLLCPHKVDIPTVWHDGSAVANGATLKPIVVAAIATSPPVA
ncbi:MAG TPA: hypothetical protein VH496_10010 [Mycobacterium sp.]